MERGKWEEERDFHIEPRRGGITIEMDIIFGFQPRRGDILIDGISIIADPRQGW